MKIKRILSVLLASIISCSVLLTPVSARDVSNNYIPIEVEGYNYDTNQVIKKTIYADPSAETTPAIPDPPTVSTYGLIGTTDRRTKVNPTEAPYNGIAKLRFDYIDGEKDRVGTGFLIAPNIIVTAAHNIKNSDNQWCENLTVTIANVPCKVQDSYVPGNWTANGHLVKDDYGVIILKQNVSNCTLFTLSSAAAGTGNYTVAGYSYWNGGVNLYKHIGTVSAYTDSDGCNVYRYKIDAISGQSGGPVYNRSNQVIGIHAYELGGKLIEGSGHTPYRENCSENEAVRVTSSIISWYNYYVNGGR